MSPTAEFVASLLSRSPEETEALGARLGRLLEAGVVVALSGELGAGKTCFARGVAAGLEVDPAVYVASPTFTLVNEYPGRIAIYHIDLYRIAHEGELVEIGLDHYLRGGDGVCLVEWLDRFPGAAPRERLELALAFDVTDDARAEGSGEAARSDQGQRRRLELRAAGARELGLARRWAVSR
jgi:tRNA threonylcarbamoyladenosine biosynthesis protein TsaE